jgi:hypothetical protein
LVLLWKATVFNLIVQAGLLAVSLSALAASQDVMRTPVAIVLAVGGLLLLAWTTYMTIKFRRVLADNPIATNLKPVPRPGMPRKTDPT